MKRNMGNLDRIFRILLGLMIGIWGMGLLGGRPSGLAFLAIIPLGTALFAFCPLYLPFGINTGSNPSVDSDSTGK